MFCFLSSFTCNVYFVFPVSVKYYTEPYHSYCSYLVFSSQWTGRVSRRLRGIWTRRRPDWTSQPMSWCRRHAAPPRTWPKPPGSSDKTSITSCRLEWTWLDNPRCGQSNSFYQDFEDCSTYTHNLLLNYSSYRMIWCVILYVTSDK